MEPPIAYTKGEVYKPNFAFGVDALSGEDQGVLFVSYTDTISKDSILSACGKHIPTLATQPTDNTSNPIQIDFEDGATLRMHPEFNCIGQAFDAMNESYHRKTGPFWKLLQEFVSSGAVLNSEAYGRYVKIDPLRAKDYLQGIADPDEAIDRIVNEAGQSQLTIFGISLKENRLYPREEIDALVEGECFQTDAFWTNKRYDKQKMKLLLDAFYEIFSVANVPSALLNATQKTIDAEAAKAFGQVSAQFMGNFIALANTEFGGSELN